MISLTVTAGSLGSRGGLGPLLFFSEGASFKHLWARRLTGQAGRWAEKVVQKGSDWAGPGLRCKNTQQVTTDPGTRHR